MTEAKRKALALVTCSRFFRNVMAALGHHGWTLETHDGSDSYCWLSQRKITLGLGYAGDWRQILLHEISHIDTCRFSNNKHTPQFWHRCENLVRRFLHAELDEHQRRHRSFASEGHYALRYANNRDDRRRAPDSAQPNGA